MSVWICTNWDVTIQAFGLLSTAVGDMMEGRFIEAALCDPKIGDKTGYFPKLSDEFDWLQPQWLTNETTRLWLVWGYLHSGSLLAKSCEAATVLGNQPDHIQQSAHCYGQHLAIARQVS